MEMPWYTVHYLETNSGFAKVEFIIWPDPEKKVRVQKYSTRFDKATLKSWLGPDGREQYLTKEEARAVYAEYQAKGYAKR
jgi:hypothetical protein